MAKAGLKTLLRKEGRMAIPKFDAGSYIIPNSRTIVLFTFL